MSGISCINVGFGIKFCSFIKSIYKNPLASINVNGYLTEYININKGIEQGYPLSVLIFIICTQIFAFSIKHNNDIQGIDITDFKSGSKKCLKLSQYADEQIIAAFDTILKYCNVSGLSLNISKTEGFWIGSLKGCYNKITGIKWPTTIRYLGIYVCSNKDEYLKFKIFKNN